MNVPNAHPHLSRPSFQIKLRHQPTARAVRVLAFAVLGAVAATVTGIGLTSITAPPAAAAPAKPSCFLVGRNAGYGFWSTAAVSRAPGTVVLRDGDGQDQELADDPRSALGWQMDFAIDRSWRPIARDASGETLGNFCAPPKRVNPTPPQPKLTWLPGTRVQGVGIRGRALVRWPIAEDNGAQARRYELTVLRDPVQPGNPQTAKTISVSMLSTTASQALVDLKPRDRVFLRAWWDDGVSAMVEAEASGQAGESELNGDTPSFGLTDVAWINMPGTVRGAFRLTWSTARDSQGRPADQYQVISRGLRTAYVRNAAFSGSVRQGIVTHPNPANQNPRSWRLRAVWRNVGPDGGPAIVEVPIFNQSWQGPGQSRSISEIEVEATTTRAKVSFSTDDCVYGDYRLVELNYSIAAAKRTVDEFNAPRDGRCYRNHGITLGRDTPALKANRAYVLTVVTTDPKTGELAERVSLVRTPPARTIGQIDTETFGLDNDRVAISGWALDPAEPASASTRVLLFVNGKRVKAVMANRGRQDMAVPQKRPFWELAAITLDHYGGDDGFVAVLNLPRTGTHKVCARAKEINPRPGQAKFPLLGCIDVERSR